MAISSITHDFIISGKKNVENLISAIEDAQEQSQSSKAIKNVEIDNSKSFILELRKKVK